MNPEKRLLLASIAFAVLWTVGMIWWSDRTPVSIIAWLIGGALIGVFWYYTMRWFMRWWEKRSTP
jgi:hypothetical protein